jgi:hypothetical protein
MVLYGGRTSCVPSLRFWLIMSSRQHGVTLASPRGAASPSKLVTGLGGMGDQMLQPDDDQHPVAFREAARESDDSQPHSRHRTKDEAFVERRAVLADATADDDGMPPPVVADDRRRDNRRRIDRMGTDT